jgi:hypothetical protein
MKNDDPSPRRRARGHARARAEDKSLTDAVRTAIDEHIDSRKKDKAFMDRLKQRHERERELYERLAR